MDNQQIIISSLAMDLKRVALSLYRGSLATANRFKTEALLRINELENESIDESLKTLVENTKKTLNSNVENTQDDILMFSTRFQNIITKKAQ